MTASGGFAQVATDLKWTREFEVLDGHAPAGEALARISRSSAAWFIVSRFDAFYLYVFSRVELLAVLAGDVAPSSRFEPPSPQDALPLETALQLHEDQGSQKARAGETLAAAEPQPGALPSRARFVELDAQGRPIAVGGADITAAPRRMRSARPASPAAAAAPPPPAPPPAPQAPPDAPVHAPLDDEGTTPVRHPSIEADGPLRAGKPVTLTIDLLLQASPTTGGGSLEITGLAPTWDTLALGVTLVSAGIDFDEQGRCAVTMRRNQASLPGTVKGKVRKTVQPGDVIEVHAQFWQGTRCCGSGVRKFPVEGSSEAETTAVAPQATRGAIAADPQADAPDLTVYITLFDPSVPGRMHWRLVTPPFDGLPAKLSGVIDLSTDPGSEAAALFKQFAVLKRGQHQQSIDGFGERLWKRAPAAFRDAYWALVDHYQRPLAIQFVSDDAHLPWELMRPSRSGEKHPPIALKHAVARWIGDHQGLLRNRLPSGEMRVMAPKYSQLSAQLTKAEATAKDVLAKAGAHGFVASPLAGTREALLGLLETPPAASVAMLYFTGHGLFNDAAPTASAIKLEKGESLAADEVDRDEVALGARDGTVVFFNACEVGATAGAIGEVGGWAGALVARRFRAFIAPLWAVDEEDASLATLELIDKIVVRREPIGAALRDLRAKHGATSPTFYSYILYGDVTARFGA
jgi:hypothetical protein